MPKNDSECPITPVENEIPDGEPVYSVPHEFRPALREIFLTRARLNKFGARAPGGEYYSQAARNEERYHAILPEIRKAVGVPDATIIEFHSAWRYTITTLEREEMRYREKMAARKPEEHATGGPTLEYMERWPDPPIDQRAYARVIRGVGKGTLARLFKL